MRFPPQFIDKLKGHALISEVISRRMPLKRHGREFQGLCPFHKEKTPSFTVNDEKGFFHCFGCSAHGDAIKFVQDYDKLSYPEAIERLAGEVGLPLPERVAYDEVKEKKITSLYDVMERAAGWFEAQLASSAGEEARKYLRERGLRDEMIRTFRIGYSPNLRDGLKQAMQAANIPEQMMKDAGLVIAPDNGAAPYDRFRGRLMFPIRDAKGRVVAFGGRILPVFATSDHAGPKYLNSPETELFKKGELLYNYDLARAPAAKEQKAIVVEGYMDAIALYQAGIPYAVAPLGTALTASHVKLLWRMCKEPALCFDGDAAGRRAMERAAELALPLLQPGMSLKFATLPAKEDPDTLVKNQGAGAMHKVIDASRSLSEVVWDIGLRAYGFDTPERQAALEKALMQKVGNIADPVVKNYYRNYFKNKLWDAGRAANAEGKKPQAASPSLTLPAHPQNTLMQFEDELVRMILHHPELLQIGEVEEAFARMDVAREELSALRQCMFEAFGCVGSDKESFMQELTKLGQGDAVRGLMKPALSALNLKAGSTHDAHALWKRMMARYELARMQQEYDETARTVAGDVGEETMLRLGELQQQIEKTIRINKLAEEEALDARYETGS